MTREEVAWMEAKAEELYGPRVEHKTRPQRVGYVYFVQEAVKGGAIKIGWAKNIRPRMASMQTGNHRKLLLLAYIGTKDRKLERKVHARFDLERISGEWFEPSPRLIAYIDQLRAEIQA